MGGTESKQEENSSADTEVLPPDTKVEDAKPRQTRSPLSTAISAVPMNLLQIACRSFEIADFHSSEYFINVLVNTHPSKSRVLPLYAKLKEYNKYQSYLDQNVGGQKALGKALILAAKYEEKFGEPISQPEISVND